MPNVFIISDTHFGHENIYQFLHHDGSKARPHGNASTGDQVMIDNWNKVVKQGDKVYHLGDVVINHKAFSILHALNGKKVLIKGNHDLFKLKDYTEHFYDIRAFHKLDNFVLTHIPIHPNSMGRFKGNVHGHLHRNIVTDQWGMPDLRYKSACVELNDYTPVELSVFQQYFLKL